MNENTATADNSRISLNSNALKVIAIIAMTIDHFTDVFYPGFL